jgi:hypothetical protein
MTKKSIKDPSIAKETFENISKIKCKLEYEKWVDYINKNLDYFTWYEDTKDGKNLKKNLHEVPESFLDKIVNSLSKTKVLAEYNEKKGFYEIVISYSQKYGVINMTYQKKITKEHLQRLLEMANYLDALLLVDGKYVINEKFILENF